MKSPEQKPKLNNEKSIPHSLAKADNIFQELREAHWKNKEMIDREMLTKYPEVLDKRLEEIDEEISFASDFASKKEKVEETVNIMKEIKEKQGEYLQVWHEEKDMKKAKDLKREINQLLSKIDRTVLLKLTPEDMEEHVTQYAKKLKINMEFKILEDLTVKWGRNTKLADIARVLREPNNQVKIIDLGWNKISIEGVEAIVGALKDSNNKVRSISFHKNKMRDAGAEKIAEALKHPNNRVQKIDLAHNEIEEAGAKSIAEALTDPHNRVWLIDLSGNEIEDIGAKAIAETFEHPNNKVQEIALWKNNISDETKREINELVRRIKQTTGRDIILKI